MAESMDSLDFLPEITVAEKDAIPLECWQEINLSDIWIPSYLLSNRNEPSSSKVHHGIYHTLEKKDQSKYAKSFSVYSLDSTGNEEGEIFISDSDDDIFGSDSISCEKLHISEDTLAVLASNTCPPSSVCSNDLKNSTKANILNENPKEDKTHLNFKENSIVSERNTPYLDEICQGENIKMTMNSNENLINWRNKQQNDSSFCSTSLSNNIHTESQKQFASLKENRVVETGGFEDRLNKNIDSGSLRDILNDTPEINIKDSAFNFKKKDDPFLLSLYDKKDTKGGKKVKKNKKDKGKKKTYIVLDNFLETNTEASQEYYCDKYFQKLLKEKQTDALCSNMDFPYLTSNEPQSDERDKEASYTNIHMGSNIDLPHLVSNEHVFPQSDKREKESSYANIHVASNTEFSYLESDEQMFTQPNKREKENFECGLFESKETNENIHDVKEIEPYTTDAICGKIVIENIPQDTTKDDILAILCGYGEIKEFSLDCTGNYFTAYVEIDLICDIDWIIECLNGSEPFGASSEKIYCYKNDS